MKPPIAYYGSKLTIAEKIVACLPEHEHYIEPYAGSLAVLLAKPPAKMETVNDLDGDLMTFWRVLRDRPKELARVCRLTPHSRSEHGHAYTDSADELEQARRVWVRLTQGRSGTLRKTGWRHYIDPGGSSISMPEYLAAYVDRLAPAAERLMSASLECLPALEIIAKYGAHKNALLYVDPPCLANTRSSTNYRHEMPSEPEHRALAQALQSVQAAVVVSGYASPLYTGLYHGWHRHEIPTWTGQGNKADPRTEVLWSNRPMNAQLQLFASSAS